MYILNVAACFLLRNTVCTLLCTATFMLGCPLFSYLQDLAFLYRFLCICLQYSPGCSDQLYHAAPYSTQLFYTAVPVCYTQLFTCRNQLPYAAACKKELLCELYGGLSCSVQLHATKQSNQFCN